MNANIERDYWNQLFANLLNACPIDTTNMQTHIVMFDNADEYIIEVNAPYSSYKKVVERVIDGKKQTKTITKPSVINGYSDYAQAVNSRGVHKNWIQNQIKQTGRIINAKITFLEGE